MRILVDYRPALRQRTGVGEYVHELVTALATQRAADGNDQIALFTSSWKDRPSPSLAADLPSVRVVDVRVPVRALVWSWNRLEWPPIEWMAGEADVVHSQSPLLIPATNAAQAVTIHDLDFLRHPDQMAAEIRRDYPALARLHAARAHAVIVSSRYAAGEVTRQLQLDGARVHVCPPGRPAWAADVLRRRTGAPGRHLLFMGTLNLRKNVGTLLEAYAQLRGNHPAPPPLVLAGHRTPASARWAARCDEPPLKGHVTMTGYVGTATKIDLYANAIALVLPSYEEGFGLPVLEAMACGVPVIVSSRGSLPEVAGPAASPIDPDDAEGFAREMAAVIDSDTTERVALGLTQAATYRWDTCAALARRAYQSAVQVHARRH